MKPAAGRVLVVGDIVTDVVAVHSGPVAVDSDTSARITFTGGGAAANTAAWLAHAGARVSLLGAVGQDAAGSARVAELATVGVDCSRVRRTHEWPTGAIVVLSDGERRTMLTDRGANQSLRESDLDDALAQLPDVVHLHLSGYTLLDSATRPAGLRALALARSGGLPASVDAASAALLGHSPAFLEWIAGVDLLLANLDEVRVLTGGGEPAQLRGAAAQVVVKLGPLGAVWLGGDDTRTVPAATATVVDTTGAGDAFAAGLLAARLAGAAVDEALEAAVRLGALAVGTVGGRPPGLTPRDR